MSIDVVYPILSLELPAIPISTTNSYVEQIVPKNSLRKDLNYFSPNAIPTLPTYLPRVPIKAMFPLVRKRGVTETIKDLGKIFGLVQYEQSNIIFWYLDILTDCLWRLQDDYRLPLEFQRIGLSWIIFFLSLLKDSNMNYTRDETFEILREVVMLAGETMDEGDPYLPRPEQLAKILTMEDCYKLNQYDETLSDSQNEELDYIDLRNGDERSLFILKQSIKSFESEMSVSTGNTLTPVSSEEVDEESMKDIEESQEVDKDEIELEQNRDMEKLSITTMLAVIDYIFEYFYNDFQYCLIRTAILNPPNYVEQKIEEFHFPKKFQDTESDRNKNEKLTAKTPKSKILVPPSLASVKSSVEPTFSSIIDGALQALRGYKNNLISLRDADPHQRSSNHSIIMD